MVDTYTIYLVNEEQNSQQFWCFLTEPEALAGDPAVFANSEVSLLVASNSPATNTFKIPVQYVVGAGASNDAVGLDIEIASSLVNNASVGDIWDVDYAVTVPPNAGPTMDKESGKAPANSLQLVTNAFHKESNETHGWFASQSFGIQTAAGFIGMTWSPDPAVTRTIVPKLTFYVQVGSFGSNKLAAWNDVSTNAAVISAPHDFLLGACTVTLTDDGTFTVTPGKPTSLKIAENLKWLRSAHHQELVALSQLDAGVVDVDYVKTVTWPRDAEAAFVGSPVVTGSLTVTVALGAAFTYFTLSGIHFQIDRAAAGATTFNFSYSGSKSAKAVKDLFVAGAKILLGGAG